MEIGQSRLGCCRPRFAVSYRCISLNRWRELKIYLGHWTSSSWAKLDHDGHVCWLVCYGRISKLQVTSILARSVDTLRGDHPSHRSYFLQPRPANQYGLHTEHPVVSVTTLRYCAIDQIRWRQKNNGTICTFEMSNHFCVNFRNWTILHELLPSITGGFNCVVLNPHLSHCFTHLRLHDHQSYHRAYIPTA